MHFLAKMMTKKQPKRRNNMMESRMKILNMLAEGVITVEEASELLKTLDTQKVQVQTEKGLKTVTEERMLKSHGKTLHVFVKSNKGDEVNVNLPITLIKGMAKAGRAEGVLKKSMNSGFSNNEFIQDNIDLELLLEAVELGVIGKIIDVESSEGDIVEISIF